MANIRSNNGILIGKRARSQSHPPAALWLGNNSSLRKNNVRKCGSPPHLLRFIVQDTNIPRPAAPGRMPASGKDEER